MALKYIIGVLLPACDYVGLNLELCETATFYKLQQRDSTPACVYLRIRKQTNELCTPTHPACVCGLYDEGGWGPRITYERFIRKL
jgi:hypothetical protein